MELYACDEVMKYVMKGTVLNESEEPISILISTISQLLCSLFSGWECRVDYNIVSHVLLQRFTSISLFENGFKMTVWLPPASSSSSLDE